MPSAPNPVNAALRIPQEFPAHQYLSESTILSVCKNIHGGSALSYESSWLNGALIVLRLAGSPCPVAVSAVLILASAWLQQAVPAAHAIAQAAQLRSLPTLHSTAE